MTARMPILFAFAVCTIAFLANSQAMPPQNPSPRMTPKQLVVLVHKSQDGPEYELKAYNLKKREANFLLAEIKLGECGDCQVVPIIDDNVELNVITQISEMAIDAGFRDVRPFVFWRKTERMAQIQFGPPNQIYSDRGQNRPESGKSPVACSMEVCSSHKA
jgi:hypothetical protein